jgi:hypothetical protein
MQRRYHCAYPSFIKQITISKWHTLQYTYSKRNFRCFLFPIANLAENTETYYETYSLLLPVRTLATAVFFFFFFFAVGRRVLRPQLADFTTPGVLVMVTVEKLVE